MTTPLQSWQTGSDSPDAPTFVGLHGFMGQGSDWEDFATTFLRLAPGWRLIFPDLPGHGRSPSLADPTIANLGTSVREWLSEMHVVPTVLAGYSLGFRVVLPLALATPSLCSALLAVSGTPGLVSPAEKAERLRRDEALAARLEAIDSPEALREFFRDWWKQPVFAPRSEWLFERLAPARLQLDPRQLASILLASSPAHSPDLRPALPAFQNPVGLACGACDTKYVSLAREMNAGFPNPTLMEFPDCSHDLLHEAPSALAHSTADWIKKTENSP